MCVQHRYISTDNYIIEPFTMTNHKQQGLLPKTGINLYRFLRSNTEKPCSVHEYINHVHMMSMYMSMYMYMYALFIHCDNTGAIMILYQFLQGTQWLNVSYNLDDLSQ